jgi:hypothetical protein
MKPSRNTSTRVVQLALLTGLFAAACSQGSDNASGTGGTSATGGSNRTGGTAGASSSQTGGSRNTGGTTTTTGGSATGGSASGGSATGGSDTGGSATGGSDTGGSASGGSDTGGSSSGGSGSGGSDTGGSNAGGSNAGGSNAGGSNAGGSNAGGSNAGGSGSGGSNAGGSGAGGTTSTGTGCSIVWDWEGTGVDNWYADTDVTLAVSTTQKVSGTQSLKVTVPALTSKAADDAGTAATSDKRGISVSPPSTSNLWPGATVTVNVWIPTGTTGLWMHVYMQSNSWANWNDTTVGTPTPGAWSTLTFTVPAATAVFPGGINALGLQFGVSGGGTFAGGDIFVDSVTVCGGTQTCSGTDTGSFDFETAGSTDGWAFKGDTAVTDTVVTQSSSQHYGTTGSGSLKVAMTAIPMAPTTGWTSRLVELGSPKAYCGQTVTFHVMADNVTGLSVEPYASANSWGWFPGTASTLATTNTWTTVTFTVPATVNFLGLQAIGLMLSNTSTSATYSGTVYIDGVTWQ